MSNFHLYVVLPDDRIFELTTDDGLPTLERCEERAKRVVVAMFDLPELYPYDKCGFFVTRGKFDFRQLSDPKNFRTLRSNEDILLWFNPNYFAVDIPF